jgi:hypothetical protein
MPNINNIGFTVKFDMLSTPTLVLTDTSTYPAGAVGIFNITQPDGYTRAGNFNSPDINSSGGTFSSAVRLSSTGGLQIGEWVIEYEIKTTDDVITTFTRIFQLDYEAATLVLREDFDVFTPKLRYFDDTVYARSNYNNGAITRAWSVVSTPTGTKTSSTISIDLIHNNNYYDANYAVSFTASVLYTHQVYAWLTVDERISTSKTSYAQTPPDLIQIVSEISGLKTILNNKVDTVSEFGAIKADFEYAEVLFIHIIDKIKTNDVADIYRDLKDLIAVLHNYQLPVYVPCNCIIYPYDLSAYFPGAVWGNITGTITSQTDLVSYIASQIQSSISGTVYAANVGNNSNTSFVITHGLNTKDVVVDIYKNINGEQVYADILRSAVNTVTVSFASAPTSNQYRVVIQK